MTLLEHVVERLAGRYIAERVALAVKENDRTWALLVDRTQGPSDRPFAERQEQLADALEAWRVNALARRIVGLTTDYVVGSGDRGRIHGAVGGRLGANASGRIARTRWTCGCCSCATN